MITGVVLARNEEQNIVACLGSLVPHVGEILLIDMESTDRTVELARPYVKRILTHPVVASFDAVRNLALGESQFDWLWFLDADERIPRKTGQMVVDAIRERGDEITAVTIPFRSFFCGKWIEHCGWWPGYTMPRVLKRGCFRFSDRLHGGVEFEGRELRLLPDPELAIEHFTYRSVEHYLEKSNRYTSAEAGYLARDGHRGGWRAAIRAMMRDLWWYYERHQGHLDGEHGWILSWLAGQYRWVSHAKLLDLGAERSVAGDDPGELVPANLDGVIAAMTEELAVLRSPAPQLPLGVVWRSPIWDPSGYADDSRLLLKALAHGPREVAGTEVRWSDARCALPDADMALLKTLARCRRASSFAAVTSCVPSCIPLLCPPEGSASLNILRATFETDRIPADWLPIIEQFDEVWVFSTHDEVSFRRSGVPPEKLRVLPSFVDTGVFKRERLQPRTKRRTSGVRLPTALKDRFVFLSVFDWQLRKGWDVLLKAYCAEFSPDAGIGLLLKVSTAHGHSPETIRCQADEVLGTLSQSLDQRPDITIWQQTLAKLEMAELYRRVDAFVLPSRGEGWGRPYMEAMASGLPTIGTRGSGNDDFMHDGNSFLISGRRVAVPDRAAAEIPVYRGHHWLEPDVGELRAVLRRVATDKEARRAVGQQAAREVDAKYSLDCARQAVEAQLQAAEARFVSLPLPSLRDAQVRVELEGEFFAGHSFSHINEQLSLHWLADSRMALSLRRVEHNPTRDRDVYHAHRLRPYFWRDLPGGPQVTIRHAFPPNWNAPAQGRWVHIQPWEYGVLPLDWVPPLRDRVDEIWAPSTYVRAVYERSGIPKEKVQVIPWGIDPDIFNPGAPRLLMPTDGRFTFLFVGGTIRRKGFDLVLEAFLTEFEAGEDVCLVVKDLGTTSFYRYGNYREQILAAMADEATPEIVYLESPLSPGQLASLYTACDCLVAPYRGEGFGLPILEAMACGLPPIVPRGGASDDFVTEDSGYMLAAREVECRHDWRLCGVPTELQLDVGELRAAMRQACANRERNRLKGQSASRAVLERFTWARTAQTLAERLLSLANQQPPSCPHGPSALVNRTPAAPHNESLDRQQENDSRPGSALPDSISSCLGEENEAGTRQVPASASGSMLPVPASACALTVCMLSHNDERTIADCLGRIGPYAREVLVLDLGSTDRSAKIALEYDVRLYGGVFADDLGSLRNALLSRATSDWILCLDADELLDEPEVEKMAALLPPLPPNVWGLRIHVRDENCSGVDILDRGVVRIFRNRNEIVFQFRSGEDPSRSILQSGGRILNTGIEIIRARAPEELSRCYRSNRTHLRLLHLDLAEHPGEVSVLLSLGEHHRRNADFFHAECYFNDCLQRSSPAGQHYPTAALGLIESHVRKGEPWRAAEVAEQIMKDLPDDAPLRGAVCRLLSSRGDRS